jgi:hypothetical protein
MFMKVLRKMDEGAASKTRRTVATAGALEHCGSLIRL